MEPSDDWQRLARHVRDRRDALGMTQEEVAAAGGPSTATQRLIERGRQYAYRPAILSRLEHALQWERGSVRIILGGGVPAPVVAGASLPPAGAGSADPEAVRRGEQIAAELQAIAAGIAGEISAARRHGVPDGEIFDDPFERNLWLTELTPEDQRVRAIAALRSARPRRNPGHNGSAHDDPPVELAGLAAGGLRLQLGDCWPGTRPVPRPARHDGLLQTPAGRRAIHRTGSGRGGAPCWMSSMRSKTTTSMRKRSAG